MSVKDTAATFSGGKSRGPRKEECSECGDTFASSRNPDDRFPWCSDECYAATLARWN